MPVIHRFKRVSLSILCTAAALFAVTDCRAESAAPAGSTPASLTEALQRLGAGDAVGAQKLLEHITQREPGNAVAWRALAKCYQQLKDQDRAFDAWRRSLVIDPASPQAFYGIGVAYAARRDASRAFQWLKKARDTHRYDMTQIEVDPALQWLHDDVRFRQLLPTPAEFRHPFVEPVKILREWRGEAMNDQFGWIARDIGDVDGDGVDDIVTSAPTHGASDSHAGRIYVYSVGSGQLLWTADGNPGDELGTGVEGAGDTNGDGIPDVIASGPSGAGVAYIYSGRDGRVLQSMKSPNADESFGSHISGAGDFDHDGYTDVIVGAPGKTGEHKSAGHVYIYSGKDGHVLLALQGERVDDEFGSTVAGKSEHGHQYLVVGAPVAGEQHHGRVYVYEDGASRPKFVIDSDATGNALGAMFVSIPGDLDGDGISEIYASDWSNNALGRSTGRIYVHSGSSGKRLFTLTGESSGEGFGTSPSNAGDVDGDGRADLIVGAWQYGRTAISSGRAYLYSGRSAKLIATYTCRTPGDTFGFDAVGVGDIDNDGIADLLITSAWSGVNGFHSGRVFIISSGIHTHKPAR